MFNREFQLSVLKLLCTNRLFATTFASILKPEYFDTQPTQIIFGIIYEYCRDYERELHDTNLQIICQEYVQIRGFSSDVAQLLKEEVKSIFKTYVASEEFVHDKLTRFVRDKAMRIALHDSIEHINKGGDFEKVLKLVDSAIATGGSSDRGFRFEDMLGLPEAYNLKFDESRLLKTGFMEYDKALGGGMAPGEVHVILGAPKAGKSTAAINIGACALMRGKTVFHISLELKREDIALKYGMRLTGLTKYETLCSRTADYKERIKNLEDCKKKLFIQYYTMNTVNAMEIRSWICQMRAQEGAKPDLIIVDYDDLLKPSGESKSMYEDAGSIYADLIAIADYFQCPLLTASQPRREAWYKFDDPANPQLITMQDLAQSAKKAHHCYSISSLNFKKNSDEGILYVDISRRGEGKKEIKVFKDYSRSLLKERYAGE